jgi:dTDP-4-dehydrorhamnose 3,5-epimerase-like enzyme
MNIKFFSTPVVGQESNINQGQLTFLDDCDSYLLKTKRVYSIFRANKGIVRGNHAHRELEQLLFCPHGAIQLVLNDGDEKRKILLDHPSKFLYIGPMVWRTMEWISDDSVLVVLVSDNYNESDYIRDYDEFLRVVKYEKNTI